MMMLRETLPVTTLPAWSRLTNVVLDGVAISSLDNGKGSGIVATKDLGKESVTLMTVPRDVVLSLETIWEYAKSDHHLHDILEAVGEFARVGVMLTSVSNLANQHGIDATRSDLDLSAHPSDIQCFRYA